MTVAANADDLPIRDVVISREAIALPSPSPLAAPTTAIVVRVPTIDEPSVWPRPTPTRRMVLHRVLENRPTRLAWLAIALGVAALYLAFLLCYWAPAHPGVDQNGYLGGAERYAYSFSTGDKPANPYGFIGRMWILAPDGTYYPKYPIGLPIVYAAAVRIGALLHVDGHFFGELLSPVSAMLATLGMFSIVRRLSGGYIAVLAMLMVGFGQVMLTLAINPNSHAAGTAAIVWGIALLVGWLERGTLWRGVAAGALLGFAYLIRYTDGLLALPLGVAMLYAARWQRPTRGRAVAVLAPAVALALLWLAVIGFGESFALATLRVQWTPLVWITTHVIGPAFDAIRHVPTGDTWLAPLGDTDGIRKIWYGALGLAALLSISMYVEGRALWRLLLVGGAWLAPVVYQTVFNMVAMRSFTSYGNTNESTGFTMDFFFANWEKMVRVVADQGLFFIAPIGLLGLIAMYRRLPMVALILTLWFVPEVLLYTAYYWAPDNMGVSYSRFVLTQLPALVVSAAWLLGEVSRGGRLANRRGWFTPTWPKGIVATAALFVGIGLIALGMWPYVHRSFQEMPHAPWSLMFRDAMADSQWWLTVVPGSLIALVSFSALLASADPALRPPFEWHASNGTARLAVGAVAFVACALGGWRSTQGSEWGQRLNARASIEIQSRENNNLAAVGNAVRDVVHRQPNGKSDGRPDDRVVLFGDTEHLHHIQWLGNYECYASDAFTPEAGRRMTMRPEAGDNDPDPLDPHRVDFAKALYGDKDQNALTLEENRLMSDSLAAGKRVFYVLNKPAAQLFERRFVKTDKFITRDAATVTDAPSPRDPTDFMTPEELPKLPVGRMGMRGRNVPDRFITPERGVYKIVEILTKPAPVVPPAMAKALAEKAAATAKPVPLATTKPTTKP